MGKSPTNLEAFGVFFDNQVLLQLLAAFLQRTRQPIYFAGSDWPPSYREMLSTLSVNSENPDHDAPLKCAEMQSIWY